MLYMYVINIKKNLRDNPEYFYKYVLFKQRL